MLDVELPEAKKADAVTGWRRTLHRTENLLVTVPLALMMILPCLDIILRMFKTSISGSGSFVQHFTLVIGMAGGAIAARDDRLLALSTLSGMFKGRWKIAASVINRGISASTTACLFIATYGLITTERQSWLANQGASGVIAFGIPVWFVQLVMPFGFAVIAFRLVWTSGENWKVRSMTAGLMLVLLLFALWVTGELDKYFGRELWMPFEDIGRLVPYGLAAILVATILGGPVYALLAGASVVLLAGADLPVSSMSIMHYSLTTNASLPTIPLFTMAGYFMAEGGASKRLVRVFQSLVGHLRGGSAVLTALACAFFTSFTGASGVTILALGGLLMPVLLTAGYSQKNALGLLTGAGSLGLLFPPCLPPILYSIVAGGIIANLHAPGVDANLTMEKMFLGGLLPGILLVVMTAAWGVHMGPKDASTRKPFDAREARAAIWEAKWELLLPVVAIASLFSGKATPVEAAAVTALYAAFVEIVIYRDFASVQDIAKTMTECGLLVGGVLLILGVAMGFTNYLVTEGVTNTMCEWVQAHISSPWAFLLALNFLLLIVGCLMDIFSAIVVVVPVIVPMGIAFHIDPIHLGVIFLANLELGFLTPPVGMNLFLSAYRFDKSMGEVTRATLPILIVLTIGVIIITYVPWMTTWLPGLVK